MSAGFRIGVDLGGTKIEAAAIEATAGCTPGAASRRRRAIMPPRSRATAALVRGVEIELGGAR